MEPALIDRWFPTEQQRHYVEQLRGRSGLTRRRAECFVKLWAYLMIKQQGKVPDALITELVPLEGEIPCTHREAAELFYSGTERGSDRAAGMMIDQLVQVGLVEKAFDGNTISLTIRLLPELVAPTAPESVVLLPPDFFNPRTDAVPVATFLAQEYTWINSSITALAHKMTRILRQWAQQYSTGMRVLRRSDNLQPVGIYIFFPTAMQSEENFFRFPSLSLHLSTITVTDPMEMAKPGDPDCTAIFVRSWSIVPPHMQQAALSQFLRDSQQTLIQMREDFPNLCDIYALNIHPRAELLAQALGFQKTIQDPQSYLCWMYMALDRFLELDIEAAIGHLNFGHDNSLMQLSKLL
ncbi:MAG: hypothetical protein HC769_04275 [Cyanobacteria bacterium CRU_2_1]|nr:hypothetical protein [Cyanobacteria bacterium RU_5_0]NJR58132.1 hypothetical protein [Cyanobacteria bacterium CRU_2_1]